MLRLTRTVIPSYGQIARRFSAISSTMAEGDTGSPKTHGYMSEKDQFVRREQANENYYVRMREQEKMAALKARMDEQEKHLKALKDHIDELTKSQGGEQN